VRDEAERQAVLRVLGRVNGNLSKAAELLGISRPTLYDLLERFGLRQPEPVGKVTSEKGTMT